MHFDPPLLAGHLIRRYKRFLADITLDNGQQVTAHCPNPGSMRACQAPGWPVRLSVSADPRRKLPYTLEMLHNGASWIGVNTLRTNAVVAEALRLGQLPELSSYTRIQPEVRYAENSRVDFLLSAPDQPDCYLEVKHVSLRLEQACAFPDAVSTRALKHIGDLLSMRARGARAVLLFAVQRDDTHFFRAAHEIDPAYATALHAAVGQGLEILVRRVAVSPEALCMAEALPFQCD